MKTSAFSGKLSWLLASIVVVLCGCDDDPTAVDNLPPVATVATDPIIPRQGSIRVVFNGPVDPTTALDPQNFIVVNQCTGLRVPGSLELRDNTLIFTPSQALPFLTALSVRIQNILSPAGAVMEQPLTFTLRTEDPPVTDVSWERLNSPTNIEVSGIEFVSREVGYASDIGGAVYRTTDGGRIWEARFKDLDVIGTVGLRALADDSVYVVGAELIGGGSNAVLLESTDTARTFHALVTRSNANFFSLSILEQAGRDPVFLMGGSQSGSLATFRYDPNTDSTHVFGPVGGLVFGQAADISPDGSSAAAVGFSSNATFTAFSGVAYRSTDGGRTFQSVSLPAGTAILLGAGFVTNTDAFLLGDSSTVLRLNAATGAVTALGEENGIPQTERDEATGRTTVYTFTRAEFAPEDRTLGWIVGLVVERQPGRQDIRRGIILQTRDGGETFSRQAVRGVEENGLGFSPLRALSVLDRNLASTGGESGFIAARKADTQVSAAVCSFTSP